MAIDCKRYFYPAWILALCFCINGSAWAHAIIKKAQPAPNGVVTEQPHQIVLEFNSRIDLKRSRLILFAADGEEEPLMILQDSKSHIVKAILDRQQPGKYRLRWEVLSQDGHVTRGDIAFMIE